MHKKVLLIILDGFGYRKAKKGNAITLADTPYFDYLYEHHRPLLLDAGGESVGLPKGGMGGSEVGHMTIGAGRVLPQYHLRINNNIRSKAFFKNKALVDACTIVKKKNSTLHIMGLLSDKGVHADINHVDALLQLAKKQGVENVYIHGMTDGRDVGIHTATKYVKKIQKMIKKRKIGKLATLIGRYYAMDRDNNWDRTKKAYDLYTKGTGTKEDSPLKALKNQYAKGIETDYYIQPILLEKEGVIKKDDVVICYNFRTDRGRQITSAFVDKNFQHFKRSVLPAKMYIFGPYSEKATQVFPEETFTNNLGDVLAKHKKNQLRVAETEKYAHATYFLNSQVKDPYKYEDRILVPSKKVANFADFPQMRAEEITNTVIGNLKKGYSFIAVNYANGDLVGHSGDMNAALDACEYLDEAIEEIVERSLEHHYHVLITADHGNIEEMITKSGDPHPSHTYNKVPLFYLSPEEKILLKKKKKPTLADIAPTILHLLGIKPPKQMTGKSLLP